MFSLSPLDSQTVGPFRVELYALFLELDLGIDYRWTGSYNR